MAKVGKDKSGIVAELPRACADETAAVEFMERQRWGKTPCCPRCGDTDVYQMRDRKTEAREKAFRWRCRGCKRQYSVRTGTIFEDSRIPMRHWCYAFWKACSSKKGVSALQIKRETGLSYKSALFLMHRIRYAMAPADEADAEPLRGTVEVDETYVGGKPRYSKALARQLKRQGFDVSTLPKPSSYKNKAVVMAMYERGGRVRARVVPDPSGMSLRREMLTHIDLDARIITDEHPAYKNIGRRFRSHETVHHTRREYVRGDVTTNGVEGWFSLLKRGVYGTFHNVSRKHLDKYVSEFQFRSNHRKVDDGERTLMAIRGAEGKRVRYREHVAAE